jgi:hypothetical protein
MPSSAPCGKLLTVKSLTPDNGIVHSDSMKNGASQLLPTAIYKSVYIEVLIAPVFR